MTVFRHASLSLLALLMGVKSAVPASPVELDLPALPSQFGKKMFAPTATELRRPSRAEIARQHEELFKPLQGEAAALSPDALHVAYSVRSGDEVSVIIRPLPLDRRISARVAVVNNQTTHPSKLYGTLFPRVSWLRWATNQRLIIQTNSGHIMAANVDGSEARVLRSLPLQPTSAFAFRKNKSEMVSRPHNSAEAIWPEDPTKLVVRSERISNSVELGDVEHAFLLLDIHTAATTRLSAKAAEAAMQTESRTVKQHWNAALAELQPHFPGQKVDVVGSEPSGRWIVYTAQNLADAGELGLLDRTRRTVTTLTRRSTNNGTAAPHQTMPVEITAPDGGRVVCTLTQPHFPRVKRAPLIVIVPAKPNEKTTLAYRPEIQALADAGFAIAEIEGYTATNQEKVQIDDAGAPRQLDHLFALIDHLTINFPVNPRSVALIGEAHGAQLALRAIQARPQQFRGAVFLDPWTSPFSWSAAAATRAKTDRDLDRPTLLLCFTKNRAAYPGPLSRHGLPVTTHLLDKVYDRQSMDEVRHAFTLITEFFYEHLYDYTATIGETQFIDDSSESASSAK